MASQSTQVATLKAKEASIASKSLTQLALSRLRTDYLTVGALLILAILGILAFLAPVITGALNVTYYETDTTLQFAEIGTPGHFFGTDELGRDHLARLLYGGRISLGVALISAIFSLLIGVTLGLLAGYYNGGVFKWVDDFLMWFITTWNSIPALYLLILIAAILRPTPTSLVIVLSITSWTFTMRLVRGQAITLRENEYVLAARAVGASGFRIMFVHILPNVISLLVVDLAQNIGFLILTESTLSFLGLGIREPFPSWGNMLSNAQSYFRLGAHLVFAPGILIVITVLCLYLIGDGLRDAFDPESEK